MKGRKNCYTCHTCKKSICTIDRDAGVTPFMIGCLSTQGCNGYMASHMYEDVPMGALPTFEWVTPTDEQIIQEIKDAERQTNRVAPESLLDAMRQWYKDGHLMLVPIKMGGEHA